MISPSPLVVGHERKRTQGQLQGFLARTVERMEDREKLTGQARRSLSLAGLCLPWHVACAVA